MPEISLAAETTRVTGTRTSRRLRASGKIPGVLYGHGVDPLPLSIDARELRHALSGDAGLNAVLSLEMEGRTQLAVAKAIQRDPTKNRVIHVDFLAVNRDEIITVDVPVLLVGEADEVRKGDGVVSQDLHTITVNSTPGNIPNEIAIDLSALRVGDTIRVADLKLPSGVTTDMDPDLVVVVAQGAQAMDVEGDEGAAEGDEAEGAEGGEGSEAAGDGEPAAEAGDSAEG